MASPPLVSVIIPSYNYAEFIPRTVDSVLAQRGPEVDVEVVIVDDGSTDNTAAVVSGMGDAVRYIQQDNHGPSAARNAGLRVAHGDFVVFLDADDWFAEGLLRSQLRAFSAHPQMDIAICRCTNMQQEEDKHLQGLWPLVNSHWHTHACCVNLAPVHSYMLRMSLARQVGYFDETLRSCEDQEYWLRCYALGAKVAANPEGLVFYRQHDGSATRDHTRMLAHDALMQVKIAGMLKTLPNFPEDKCAGWLAHARGSLNAACRLLPYDAGLSLTMQERFTCAALNAAPLFRKSPQGAGAVQVLHIRQYYIGRCLLLSLLADMWLTPVARKVVAVLRTLAPKMAELSAEDLDARLKGMHAKLCVSNLPTQLLR